MNTKRNHYFTILLLLLFAILTAILCFSVYVSRSTSEKLEEILNGQEEQKELFTSKSDTDDSSISFMVNSEPLTIDLSKPGSAYNVKTLNTDYDTLITTSDHSHAISVNGQDLSDGSSTVKLSTLSNAERITLTIDKNNYYLRTLPSDMPSFTAVGQSSKDGFFYTTLGSYVTKFDAKGNLVFYRDGNAADSGPFRRNEIDGEVLYSYLEVRPSLHHEMLNHVNYRMTALILLNEKYEKIDEVTYMIPTDTIPEKYPLENHDYKILGKDHYILSTYIGKKVTNIPEDVRGSEFGANVAACVFQEVKDGQVIFEWDTTDHPELYDLSIEACDYTNSTHVWADYAHMNAVSIDPRDGNFLCSFRDFDSILKIDRKTGEILWYLGGKYDSFNITEEQQFHRQHDISVTEDGYYMLFDNGCLMYLLGYPTQTAEEKAAANEAQYSRVLKFKLNEETMEIEEFYEYRVEDFYSASMGSAQLLNPENDTILIGWGGKSRQGMPYFQEIDFSTNIINFEMLVNDDDMNCYRVLYYDK